MVATKAEATAKQIEDLTTAINSLKTDLTTKIDDLSLTTSQLGGRIDSVRGDITAQLLNLEAKFDGEVKTLRASTIEINDRLNTWKGFTSEE